jgi:homogentisate 1,2-dioxygenase
MESLRYQPGFSNEFATEALPLPSEPKDFVDGLLSIAGNDSPASQSGTGIHIYTPTASMGDRFFCKADGELQVIQRQGLLAIVTELGMPYVWGE